MTKEEIAQHALALNVYEKFELTQILLEAIQQDMIHDTNKLLERLWRKDLCIRLIRVVNKGKNRNKKVDEAIEEFKEVEE